jgi:hypothetical protein
MTNADGPSDDRRIRQVGFGIAVLFVAVAVIMLILNLYWMTHHAGQVTMWIL